MLASFFVPFAPFVVILPSFKEEKITTRSRRVQRGMRAFDSSPCPLCLCGDFFSPTEAG